MNFKLNQFLGTFLFKIVVWIFEGLIFFCFGTYYFPNGPFLKHLNGDISEHSAVEGYLLWNHAPSYV